MKLFDRRFDFVFSIGEDCACASYLNRNHLRIESSPFDWLTRASFEERVKLLETGFAGFMVKDNLYPVAKPCSGYKDEKCDYYGDRATDFYFYHDFAAGVPLDESYPAVREKYARRIARLLNHLNSSERILMIWWSRDKHVPGAQLKEALRRLKCRFAKASLRMLVFEHSPSSPRVDHIADDIVRITDAICPDPMVTWGDALVSNRYFKKISVTYTAKWMRMRDGLLYSLAWCLSKFHWSRTGRQHSCDKWVQRFGIKKRRHEKDACHA